MNLNENFHKLRSAAMIFICIALIFVFSACRQVIVLLPTFDTESVPDEPSDPSTPIPDDPDQPEGSEYELVFSTNGLPLAMIATAMPEDRVISGTTEIGELPDLEFTSPEFTFVGWFYEDGTKYNPADVISADTVLMPYYSYNPDVWTSESAPDTVYIENQIASGVVEIPILSPSQLFGFADYANDNDMTGIIVTLENDFDLKGAGDYIQRIRWPEI